MKKEVRHAHYSFRIQVPVLERLHKIATAAGTSLPDVIVVSVLSLGPKFLDPSAFLHFKAELFANAKDSKLI